MLSAPRILLMVNGRTAIASFSGKYKTSIRLLPRWVKLFLSPIDPTRQNDSGGDIWMAPKRRGLGRTGNYRRPCQYTRLGTKLRCHRQRVDLFYFTQHTTGKQGLYRSRQVDGKYSTPNTSAIQPPNSKMPRYLFSPDEKFLLFSSNSGPTYSPTTMAAIASYRGTTCISASTTMEK